jgi:predicted lipoprotein with Yx(FWY)xxD motif
MIGVAALGVSSATTAAAGPAGASVASHSHHKGIKISTVKTSLGRVVSSKHGHVMFRFMKDTHNKSHCNASCQAVWPPVTSKKKARAGHHIKASKLGHTKKHHQVTYYGHPLYYYVGDPHHGKTTGDGTKEFGDKWYVVSPHGKPVKPKKHHGSGPPLPTGPADVATGMAGGVEILTNSADSHTVYELSTDAPPAYGCDSSCTDVWPPLLTLGAPTASGDAMAADLGTVNRKIHGESVTQVTYAGHPLYEYSGDTAAGQDNGQYQYEPVGGYWYDLFPDGMPNPALHP